MTIYPSRWTDNSIVTTILRDICPTFIHGRIHIPQTNMPMHTGKFAKPNFGLHWAELAAPTWSMAWLYWHPCPHAFHTPDTEIDHGTFSPLTLSIADRRLYRLRCISLAATTNQSSIWPIMFKRPWLSLFIRCERAHGLWSWCCYDNATNASDAIRSSADQGVVAATIAERISEWPAVKGIVCCGWWCCHTDETDIERRAQTHGRARDVTLTFANDPGFKTVTIALIFALFWFYCRTNPTCLRVAFADICLREMLGTGSCRDWHNTI